MKLSITDNPSWQSQSVYGSPEYGKAAAIGDKGTWVSVHDENGLWNLPLAVREIPNSDFRDATTPYGYGGLEMSEILSNEAVSKYWEATRVLLENEGIVSAFLRFPPFLPNQAKRAAKLDFLDVAIASKTVLVPAGNTESMLANLHKRSRYSVRTAEKRGCTVEILPSTPSLVASIRELYEATMRRVKADDRYFFPESYYTRLGELGEQLVIARVTIAEGALVAGCFVLRDRSFAHYHLSGSTGDQHGANNLMIWSIMKWASEQGLQGVHLGGGLTADDSLFKFKSSFGGDIQDFAVGKVIVNPEAYASLTDAHAYEHGVDPDSLISGSFFPAYRSTVVPAGQLS